MLEFSRNNPFCEWIEVKSDFNMQSFFRSFKECQSYVFFSPFLSVPENMML